MSILISVLVVVGKILAVIILACLPVGFFAFNEYRKDSAAQKRKRIKEL